jgi:uncharacterized protein (TIGR02646 family)
MRYIKRPDSPVSKDVQKSKSHQFGDARLNNPAHTFQWATISGITFNHICKPVLLGMTDGHCAYCDLNDLGSGAKFSIDHLRPKSKHPRLSHIWINLYSSCGKCQEAKGENTDKKTFRPDETGYSFRKYFTLNAQTGDIEVIPNLGGLEDARANATLEYFGLNEYGRPTVRKTELKKMISILDGPNLEGIVLDDFSYRFMWVA